MRRLTIACAVFCSLTCVAWASGTVVRPDARSGSRHARSARAASATRFLFGDRAIEPNSDRSRARVARAFPFKADHTGTARSIALYVDRGSSARKILVGMYNSAAGKPAKLVASGSLTNATSGQWDSVDIGSAPVTAQRTYWLVVVGQGGTAHLRDRVAGNCTSEASVQRGIQSLPRAWKAGQGERACAISSYAAGTLAPSAGKANAPATTATTPPTTPGATLSTPTSVTTPGATLSTPTTTTTAPTLPNLLAPTSTGAPVVAGTAQQGSTLSTTNGTWSNLPSGYDYAWEDCAASGASCATIAGATSNTYTLVAGDVGHTIRSVVTASNLLGSGQAASAATSTVVPPAPSSIAAPTVTGTAAEGQTLSTTNGSWTNSPTSYSYGWEDCSSAGGNCSAISGASSSSYTLAATDVGHTIRALVNAANAGGSASATSAQTGAVGGGGAAPSNSVAPVVSGSAEQGDSVSSSSGSWTGSPTYAYQWQGCDAQGSGCANISGATSSAYVLGSGDVGGTVRSVVTGCNASGCASAASAVSGVVVASGGAAPTSSGAPGVVDTTLANNYEAPDGVQGSAGSWGNCGAGGTCTYTYQFEHCTGITGTSGTGCAPIGGSPQCSATSSASCDYTLSGADVGDYIVSSVTASNGSATSAPAVSRAVGPVVASRVNTFCTASAAYSNLTAGPHLCGWPDSTNVGYVNAPGYPGSLTTASSGSATCPTTPVSNHTYSFCLYDGGTGTALNIPSGLTNVTFYGDVFESNAVNEWDVHAGAGANGITFNYDTFKPLVAAPQASGGVACANSYQYGIYNENAAMTGFTVEHSDFWGFGNAIDTAGSTQSTPQTFKYNWFHDASTDESPCNYHNDGIGNLNSGTEEYAVVDHNTMEFKGNTNLIAWQNGTYSHDQNTNNLLSGDNQSYAGGRCTSSCTAPTYIQTTGNTLSTYLALPNGAYPIDNATHYWAATGSTWNHNYWAVPSGAAWGTAAYNGYFWVPTTNSSEPQDCGFVSPTDYPSASNPCS